MSTPTSIPLLVASLRSIISSNPNTGWDEAWKSNVTPWDASVVQPALKELLEERWDTVVAGGGPSWESLKDGGGRALIAGCGKGYDATFIASLGMRSLGVDLSPTAVGLARELFEKSTQGNELLKELVEFQNADFFDPASAILTPAAFSLAYDYTFLCAIPPSLRIQWARRYKGLVRKGGVLITLVFPIDGDRESGPPYSVSPELYQSLLGGKEGGFTKIYEQLPEKTTHPNGLETMCVWRRD